MCMYYFNTSKNLKKNKGKHKGKKVPLWSVSLLWSFLVTWAEITLGRQSNHWMWKWVREVCQGHGSSTQHNHNPRCWRSRVGECFTKWFGIKREPRGLLVNTEGEQGPCSSLLAGGLDWCLAPGEGLNALIGWCSDLDECPSKTHVEKAWSPARSPIGRWQNF